MSGEKILLVSRSVFPMPSGSSVIVNNLASQFSKDEMVLLGEEVRHKSYEAWPRLNPDIYRVNLKYSSIPRLGKYFKFFELKKTIRIIKDVAIKEGCTAILAINPDEYFLCASYLASKSLYLSFYSWFHNTLLDNHSGLMKLIARWIQVRVFENSNIVFTMSEGMQTFFEQKYPNVKFTSLVHGFNIPNVTHIPFSVKNIEKLSFAYTGSLNESCREASVRLCMTIINNPNYTLHIYAGFNKSIFENYGIVGDNVIHHGFVPLERLQQELLKHDIMLLPHGFDGNRTSVEYATIFPTRTIPLLYSNRPILGHMPENVFLTDFLRRNQCAKIVSDKSGVKLLQAIEDIINNTRQTNQMIKNALQTAQLFSVERTAKKLKYALKLE